MLSKLVIFTFAFLGIFSLLFISIPSSFYANQASWNPTYFNTSDEVCEYFNDHNITVYDSQTSGALTFDEHDQIAWGSGKELDVWWDDEIPRHIPYYALGISYETQHWFMGVWEYWTYERLHFTSASGVERGDFVYKEELLEDFSDDLNGTLYDARCNSGVQVNILYTGNGTGTLEQSWDAGQLAYLMSYELNASSSSVNMFTLLGQILTFQAPSMGISGWFGDLLNAMIAIPIYSATAFIIYKLITGIAPWLSGGSGD